MDKDHLGDIQKSEIIIDNSNEYETIFIGGEVASAKVESVAKKYRNRITE